MILKNLNDYIYKGVNKIILTYIGYENIRAQKYVDTEGQGEAFKEQRLFADYSRKDGYTN